MFKKVFIANLYNDKISCPVCNYSLHELSYKGEDEISKIVKGNRLVNWPKFFTATDHEKGFFLKKSKVKLKGCVNCVLVGITLLYQ